MDLASVGFILVLILIVWTILYLVITQEPAKQDEYVGKIEDFELMPGSFLSPDLCKFYLDNGNIVGAVCPSRKNIRKGYCLYYTYRNHFEARNCNESV